MKKADLKKVNNLKLIIKDIRGYLAGNATGITRDEVIVQNLMLLVFCKIYDEQKNGDSDLQFVANKNETPIDLSTRINALFIGVKDAYPDIFDKKEKITLAPKDLLFVVKKLENIAMMSTERDVIADLFEELIGVAFRGGEGQFFTPKNVVKTMVEMLQPKAGEKIIDPACGSAGFLVYSYLYANKKGVNDCEFYGIEKDSFLAKISKMYLSVLGLDSLKIACDNSLLVPEDWLSTTRSHFQLEKFDVAITNPPFGAKIPITDRKILSNFKLGHVWKKENDNSWTMTDEIYDKQPPQILFIERIIELLKIGGRAGIVLPDGIFGNASSRYIWEYIKSVCRIDGVVSLTQEAFMPSTHTKTSVLFVTRLSKEDLKKPYNIFMAVADTVGHDKNGKGLFLYKKDGTYVLDEKGKPIIDNCLPELIKQYVSYCAGDGFCDSKLGFVIKSTSIKNNIYVPASYFAKEAKSNSQKYEFKTIGELIEEGQISVKRGNEIGSKFYGTGEIPFVRTSDIVNWEVKADPIKAVSEEAYLMYKDKQHLKVNDILFVNDGTFLIGRSAMLTEASIKCIIQSHLRKITVLKNDYINAFYLFYLLNTPYIQKQIKSKVFTQATLSTLGNRLEEISLPISKDKKEIERITEDIKSIFRRKNEIKNKIDRIMNDVDFE